MLNMKAIMESANRTQNHVLQAAPSLCNLIVKEKCTSSLSLWGNVLHFKCTHIIGSPEKKTTQPHLKEHVQEVNHAREYYREDCDEKVVLYAPTNNYLFFQERARK